MHTQSEGGRVRARPAATLLLQAILPRGGDAWLGGRRAQAAATCAASFRRPAQPATHKSPSLLAQQGAYAPRGGTTPRQTATTTRSALL